MALGKEGASQFRLWCVRKYGLTSPSSDDLVIQDLLKWVNKNTGNKISKSLEIIIITVHKLMALIFYLVERAPNPLF